jgi:hypothetical protein
MERKGCQFCQESVIVLFMLEIAESKERPEGNFAAQRMAENLLFKRLKNLRRAVTEKSPILAE